LRLPQTMLDPPPHEVICRHWLGLVLVGALAVTLLPAWGSAQGFFDVGSKAHGGHVAVALDCVANQLVSFYLLPAMGFWLALRRGAIDLSVWAVAGLGGLLAATLINAGLPVAAAFGLAVGAGLAIGAVNGLVAAWTRLSSPAFTLIVAAIIIAGAGHLSPGRDVRVPAHTFGSGMSASGRKSGGDRAAAPAANSESEPQSAFDAAPLSSQKLRMLLVFIMYSTTMVVLLSWGIASRRRHWTGRDRFGIFAAMAASGALAAAGGAFWLVDHGSAPLPTRLIGDLRIPAAAILAGGALWLGRGRTLLSGIFLPISVLLATAWRQEVTALTTLRSSGYAVQLLLLTAMLLSAHLALLGLLRSRGAQRTMATVSLALIVAALAAMAAQALLGPFPARRAIQLACFWLWVAAAIFAMSCAPWSRLTAART